MYAYSNGYSIEEVPNFVDYNWAFVVDMELIGLEANIDGPGWDTTEKGFWVLEVIPRSCQDDMHGWDAGSDEDGHTHLQCEHCLQQYRVRF